MFTRLHAGLSRLQDLFLLAGRCVDAWLDTFVLFSRAIAPKNRPTVEDAEAVWRGMTLLAGEISRLSSSVVCTGDLLPRHLIDAFIELCVSSPKDTNGSDEDGHGGESGTTDPEALAAARAKAEVARRLADAVQVARGAALKFNRYAWGNRRFVTQTASRVHACDSRCFEARPLLGVVVLPMFVTVTLVDLRGCGVLFLPLFLCQRGAQAGRSVQTHAH